MATRGTTSADDETEGDNRITFEGKAKFKDNFCDVSVFCYSVADSAWWCSNVTQFPKLCTPIA